VLFYIKNSKLFSANGGLKKVESGGLDPALFWADHKWNTEWQKNTSQNRKILLASAHLFQLLVPHYREWPYLKPKPSLVRLNRLRIGVGLFRSTMHKWGLVPSVNYKCGAEEQTDDHILASCYLYQSPNGKLGLAALDDDTVDWLKRTALNIWWQDRVDWLKRTALNIWWQDRPKRRRRMPWVRAAIGIRLDDAVLHDKL